MNTELMVLRAVMQGNMPLARIIGEHGPNFKDTCLQACENRRQVNKFFRSIDESKLFPVCGRFNATERAIRRVRKLEREGLCLESPYEYGLALDAEISRIVNAAI